MESLVKIPFSLTSTIAQRLPLHLEKLVYRSLRPCGHGLKQYTQSWPWKLSQISSLSRYEATLESCDLWLEARPPSEAQPSQHHTKRALASLWLDYFLHIAWPQNICYWKVFFRVMIWNLLNQNIWKKNLLWEYALYWKYRQRTSEVFSHISS